MKDFSPYSKETQLRGSQKEKDTPNFKQIRYNRRRKQSKKVDYKGVKIPSKKNRGEFKPKQRKQIEELFGHECLKCKSPYIQHHHRYFRSHDGRNNPRNGAPLCDRCHREVHAEFEKAQALRDEAEKKFGPYYHNDKYDLWKAGLIDRPTDRLFERFMKEEEQKAKERRESAL